MIEKEHILESSVEVNPPICGIYFLIHGDEIVYVGQSVDVEKRLRHHIGKGTKQFNRYFIEECKAAELNDLEAEYIVAFGPRYNTTIPVNSKWTTYNVILRDYGPASYRRLQELKISSNDRYCLIADFVDLPRLEG